ncbi:MAG TPA: FAD-binding protein [Anaeromyxobacteraceae bacterium]|nr:FAD-binding protein [Anaeromyxobacteraceae bacterium]
MHADVLVIGGGMAGAMAALAARAVQARVVLVRRAKGATALSSGAVGVAPDVWAAQREPFASRLTTMAAARRVAASRSEHPYAVVGGALEGLEDALAFAAAELAELFAPPQEHPSVLATPYGAIVSCGLAQRTMVEADLVARRSLLAVVGFRGHLGFDAHLVASGLARWAEAGAPRAVAMEIDLFMREDQAVARPHELARALEVAGAAEEAGRLVRNTLPVGAEVALFPPVLGLSPSMRVMERIAEAAGVPVAETVSDVPSVPGLRLVAALEARLAAAGVPVISGSLSAAEPGEPAHVDGREVCAASWVLATGRYVGGGVVRRGRLREALLEIPVQASEAGVSGVHLAGRPAATLTFRERRLAHPLMAAGIRVDRSLRPLDAAGRPVHPRLFAAGAVIGGHDAAADGTGLGVAILTGILAGRAAAGA